MPLPQYADAVIFPHGRLRSAATIGDAMTKANRILGPVMGCQKIRVARQHNFNFATPHINADGTPAPLLTLLFPTGHPLEKSERLTWYVATQDPKTNAWTVDESPLFDHSEADDAIKFGYKKPDPMLETETVATPTLTAAQNVVQPPAAASFAAAPLLLAPANEAALAASLTINAATPTGP